MGMKLVEGGAATGDPLLVARAEGTNPVDHESCSLRLGADQRDALAVDIMDDLGDGPQRRAIGPDHVAQHLEGASVTLRG